jgi:hypothetical protein
VIRPIINAEPREKARRSRLDLIDVPVEVQARLSLLPLCRVLSGELFGASNGGYRSPWVMGQRGLVSPVSYTSRASCCCPYDFGPSARTIG